MNEILGKHIQYPAAIQGTWINDICEDKIEEAPEMNANREDNISNTEETQELNTASPISIKEVRKLGTDGPVPNGADTFVMVLIILFMIFLKF